MITITAILRARPGTGAAMRQALLDVAVAVRPGFPDTLELTEKPRAASGHSGGEVA